MDKYLHFEALMVKDKTILSTTCIKLEPFYRNSEPVIVRLINCKMTVYSTLLDEVLNVDNYLIIEDSVSKMFIFKLSHQMYTMADVHEIGLKNFQNAYLIIERMNIDFGRFIEST